MASAKGMRPSGIPKKWTACWDAIATDNACGSARPMSSEAKITSRRAMNSGSSPDSIIRASQYRAPSGDEPRTDLMKAEMVS